MPFSLLAYTYFIHSTISSCPLESRKTLDPYFRSITEQKTSAAQFVNTDSWTQPQNVAGWQQERPGHCSISSKLWEVSDVAGPWAIWGNTAPGWMTHTETPHNQVPKTMHMCTHVPPHPHAYAHALCFYLRQGFGRFFQQGSNTYLLYKTSQLPLRK